MSAIRPNLPPALPQRPFAADAARSAQAAFFQAALGQPAAARPAAAVDTPVRSVSARSPLFPDTPAPAVGAPERPLRPGALLDIRI